MQRRGGNGRQGGGEHGSVAASAEIVIVSRLSKDLSSPPRPIREITQICKCAIPINLIHIIMQRKEIEFKKKSYLVPSSPPTKAPTLCRLQLN